MCYIVTDSSSHENIIPVKFSVQQIIKHVTIHLDVVFAVSILSGLEAIALFVPTHFMCPHMCPHMCQK